MKFFRFALPVFIGLAILGCQTARETQPPTASQPTTETQTPPPIAQLPDTQVKAALTPERADAIMADVVEAINSENVAYLLPYMLERDRNPANVEAALDDYQTYFNGEPIDRVERERVEQLGQTGNQLPIQRFHYRLYSESGISKPIALYQDDSIRLTDEFFLYSHWSKSLLDRVLTSLKSENPEQLAQALTVDDGTYSASKAEEAIANYQAKFDLDTLAFRFDGIGNNPNSFNYIISGSKNGETVEHAVQVVFGDGLVGIRDEWIPAT